MDGRHHTPTLAPVSAVRRSHLPPAESTAQSKPDFSAWPVTARPAPSAGRARRATPKLANRASPATADVQPSTSPAESPNPRIRSYIDTFDMTEFLTSSDDLRKVRPYVGESLYALVFSYRTILGRIVVLIQQGLKADYDTPTSASWSRQAPRRGWPANPCARIAIRQPSASVARPGAPAARGRTPASTSGVLGSDSGTWNSQGAGGPRCGAQIGVGMWGQPLVAIYIIWAFYLSLSSSPSLPHLTTPRQGVGIGGSADAGVASLIG